jgi:hypothetical protein
LCSARSYSTFLPWGYWLPPRLGGSPTTGCASRRQCITLSRKSSGCTPSTFTATRTFLSSWPSTLCSSSSSRCCSSARARRATAIVKAAGTVFVSIVTADRSCARAVRVRVRVPMIQGSMLPLYVPRQHALRLRMLLLLVHHIPGIPSAPLPHEDYRLSLPVCCGGLDIHRGARHTNEHVGDGPLNLLWLLMQQRTLLIKPDLLQTRAGHRLTLRPPSLCLSLRFRLPKAHPAQSVTGKGHHIPLPPRSRHCRCHTPPLTFDGQGFWHNHALFSRLLLWRGFRSYPRREQAHL